jgi:plasmid stability protein
LQSSPGPLSGAPPWTRTLESGPNDLALAAAQRFRPIKLHVEDAGSFAINACISFVNAIALIADQSDSEVVVAQLVVRNLDEDLVQALKKRAAAQGSSAEEAHRQILQAALRRPKRRRFADVLAAMPNVGEDADFVRQQADRRG